MIKKINYKNGELRKSLCYYFWKRITPDNYTISRTKAWEVAYYNKSEDTWYVVTVFAIEENADKFINMVALNSDLFEDPSDSSLRRYAYELFKDS